MVLEAQSDMISGSEPSRPEELAQTIRTGIELGKREGLTTVGHDDRRLVGVQLDVRTGVHGSGR